MFVTLAAHVLNSAPCYAETETTKSSDEEIYTTDIPLESIPEIGIEIQPVRFRTFTSGNPKKKQIALTFDDGPHPVETPKLLNVLQWYDVKATFFFVGSMVEKYDWLVELTKREGHTIGNHTHNHKNLTTLTDDEIRDEICKCGDVIQNITGKRPTLLRAPGGNSNKRVVNIANELGYTLVLWTVNSRDYTMPGSDFIIEFTLKHAQNGGIVLMHDGPQQTLDALPELIRRFREKGYEFVTVDELIENR